MSVEKQEVFVLLEDKKVAGVVTNRIAAVAFKATERTRDCRKSFEVFTVEERYTPQR